MNTAQTSTKRKYKYQTDVIELKNKILNGKIQ